MSNRSAKFVCALFASILAGVNFGAVAENATKPADNTKAADNCLSGPKGAVPAGSHWYYRLDRATKRQCWYVGEEKNKTAPAAPQDQVASTEAADTAPPQQPPPPVSRSVADARAEWSSPKPSVAPAPNVTGSIAAAGNSQGATAPDNAQSSAIASRWPDTSEVNSSGNLQLAAADLAASSQVDARPAPQPAVNPVVPTGANSPLGKPSNSTQTLLIVMASALAFAGLVATLIFRFTRRPMALADIDDNRPPAPWDSIHGAGFRPKTLWITSPAGAAGCERTRSDRCGVRA